MLCFLREKRAREADPISAPAADDADAEGYAAGEGDADADADADADPDADAGAEEFDEGVVDNGEFEELVQDGRDRPLFVTGDRGQLKAPAAGCVFSEVTAGIAVGATWEVPCAKLPPGAVEAILRDLTCVPNKERQAKNPFRKKVQFCLGAVDARTGLLHLPPWYAVQALPNSRPVASRSTTGKPMGPDVAFTGELREDPPQVQAAARYFEWVRAQAPGMPTSCILSLPCGKGKTVLCLHLLAALGRVALVLCHTNALVDQWLEEARRFLGPKARLGHVKAGGDVRVVDVDVVVASLVSLKEALARGDAYTAHLKASVGTVVLDEGHHAVATTFWEVLRAIPAAFRLVLTATPRRGDGLLPQLQWVTGPVIFRAFRNVDDVHVLHVCFSGPGHRDIVRRGQLAIADMVSALCEDEVRTQLAVDIIVHLVTTQRRRVVVVTPLVSHLHSVADAVEARLAAAGVAPRVVPMFVPDKFKAPRRKAHTDEAAHKAHVAALKEAWVSSGPHGNLQDVAAPCVGRVLAGTSTTAREVAFEAHVVVATYTMLCEGVSYKAWDTLVSLANSGDCEQVVGRILRECPGKRVPLVVDFWLPVSVFAGTHAKRTRYYRDEGFTQTRVHAANFRDVASTVWVTYDRDVRA